MIPDFLFQDSHLALVYAYCLSRLGPRREVTMYKGQMVPLNRYQVLVPKEEIAEKLQLESDQILKKLDSLQSLHLLKYTQSENYYLVQYLSLNYQDAADSVRLERSEVKPDITFSELARRYLEHMALNNFSPKTIENQKRVIKHFEAFRGGNTLLRELKAMDLEHYIVYRRDKVSISTLNMDIRTIRPMLNRAEVWGYLDKNPFKEVKPIRQIKRMPQIIRNNDFPDFLKLIDNPLMRNIVEVAALTGMRRGEIINLQWSDVDFDQDLIIVQSSEFYRVKHGEVRSVIMNHRVREIVKNLPPSDPFVFTNDKGNKLCDDYVTKRFKTYARIWGGPDEELHFHSLRATNATWLKEKGANGLQLKGHLGHLSLSTTEAYIRNENTDMRDLMEAITPKS